MILYRDSDLAEVTGVPDYFVEELGQLQINRGVVRMTWCNVIEGGHSRLLMPRYDCLRPLAGFCSISHDIRRLLAHSRVPEATSTVIERLH